MTTETTTRIYNRDSTPRKAQKARERSKSKSENTCPECQEDLTKDATGEIHCPDCGFIPNQSNIDHGPEWREYDSTESKSRVGSALTETMHDKGMSTTIGWKNKDSKGNTLSSRKRSQINRLRKWNNRCRTTGSKERGVEKGLSEVSRMCSALGLPKHVKEIASVLFKRASEDELLVGRSIEGMATGAVYVAAKQSQIPRTFEEIEPVSRIDIEQVKRDQNHIRRELNLGVEPTTPDVYLPRFATKLDLPQEVLTEAERLTKHYSNSMHLSGKKPSGAACAALYVACLYKDHPIRQQKIQEKCPITAVTLRNTYKEFIDSDPETDLYLEEIENWTSVQVKKALQ